MDIPAGKPPPGVKPNFVNPASLEPATIAVTVILQTVETVLVGLRLLANSSGGRKLWWNDYMCILAFAFATVSNALILGVSKVARHSYDIPFAWYEEGWYFKDVYVLTIFLTLATFCAKNSMLLLYLRVFTTMGRIRQAIIAGMIFTIPVYLITIVLESVYCTPPAGSTDWGYSVAQNCSHASPYAVGQGIINVVLDLYIIGIPIYPILHLHLSLRRRLQILSIFATGALALVSSIIGMVFRAEFQFDNTDVGWSTAGLFICLMCETNVIIICSCMPALAALSKTQLAESSILRPFYSLLPSSIGKSSASGVAQSYGKQNWSDDKNGVNQPPYHPHSESDVELIAAEGITKATTIYQSSVERTSF